MNYLAMCGGCVIDHTALHGIRVLQITLPWYKMERYYQGNKFKIGE
jgi:hypothetical protein